MAAFNKRLSDRTGTLDLNGFDQTIPSIANARLVNMGTGTAPGTVLATSIFTGTGGTLALSTFLAGDNSPSDQVVINEGRAIGTSGLLITNAGGPGDLTLGNGIPVIVATNGGTTTPGGVSPERTGRCWTLRVFPVSRRCDAARKRE